MSIRNFKKAAESFFDTMATFTSTELMDYRTFCKYAIFSCLMAQERKDIKKEVCQWVGSLQFDVDCVICSDHPR